MDLPPTRSFSKTSVSLVLLLETGKQIKLHLCVLLVAWTAVEGTLSCASSEFGMAIIYSCEATFISTMWRSTQNEAVNIVSVSTTNGGRLLGLPLTAITILCIHRNLSGIPELRPSAATAREPHA